MTARTLMAGAMLSLVAACGHADVPASAPVPPEQSGSASHPVEPPTPLGPAVGPRAPSRPPAAGSTPSDVVVDSDLTLDQAIAGKRLPDSVRRQLRLVSVVYLGFDGRLHRGQLVVNAKVASEVRAIFAELSTARFPIESVVPVVAYGWDDESSMRANNTSAFNYRTVAGSTTLSNHAYGLAIDLNPRLNPAVRHGKVDPPGSTYEPSARGTVVADGSAVRIFTSHGWRWGGDWRSLKDYQHFEKPAT
jgi:peptidoglycan LD-endopeptidase CwlK